MNFNCDLSDLSPVCLFVYGRLDLTKKTVEALKKNYLSKHTILYIFSDGFKNENDKPDVLAVRNYIKSIIGFKKIVIFSSKINQGLSKSIIKGISKVINIHKKVIVLEDDLVTSKNFLDFMNLSLNFYEDFKKISSISGFSPAAYTNINEDIYFFHRFFCWGWGTWEDRWSKINFDLEFSKKLFKTKDFKKKINKGGSDQYRMLKNTIQGKLRSWAILVSANVADKDLITVCPTVSKIKNIGFDSQASNSISFHKFLYSVKFDYSKKRDFKFSGMVKFYFHILFQVRLRYSAIVRAPLSIINYFHEKIFI